MAALMNSPSSSPPYNTKESTSLMGSSPMFSPGSEKRFWSNLRGRVDTLLENRKCEFTSYSTQTIVGESDRANQLKEDSLLLLRGFDSVSNTLSHLSNNLENALQAAKDLAKPPTLTELFHSNGDNTEIKQEEDSKKGLKRKLNSTESSEEDEGDDEAKENAENPHEGKLKRAKNIAISMATKAATLGRELRSIKSDLSFMQERCILLEEENKRLRDGFDKGIRPEEDDLVRLQLEALLGEKSRLANENANLKRENQCLHQLVEYHQLTSQDLSESYENVIQGMCLDFSSPSPTIQEENEDEDEEEANDEDPETPRSNVHQQH